MEAVATRDIVAFDFLHDAVLAVAHDRTVGLEVAQADVQRLVDGRGADGGARVHQVAGHLGLAIDRHRLAGQRLEVDAAAHAVERDLGPVMDEALALQPRAGARLVDQRDRALFEHAGADAAEHIVLRFLFEDDRLDAGAGQQLAEQQSGGTRTDNDNLRAHELPPCGLRDFRAEPGSSSPGRAKSRPFGAGRAGLTRPAILAIPKAGLTPPPRSA